MRRHKSKAPSRRMGNEGSSSLLISPKSVTPLDWFLDAEGLDHRTALVAFALSHHLDAEGHAFPSVERLAAMTRMTPRTVESRLQVLMGLGLIEDTGHKAGPRGTTRVLQVKNYRPASWQKSKGLPLSVGKLSTQDTPTPAKEAPTPAVGLTTSALREQANKGTPFLKKAEEPQAKAEAPATKPSQAIKDRLAEVKASRPVTVQGVRVQTAHQRPATAFYGPPGATSGPLVRPTAPESFGSVLSRSLLAALSDRSNPH